MDRHATGPWRHRSVGIAAAMGEVDVAFIVGLVVAGLGYVLLTRSLDVSHELELIES